MAISIGYVSTVVGILLPLGIYAYQIKAKNLPYILFAILSFATAIGFRMIDQKLEIFPMGSHWLWHSFGAIAVFFLMNYIFLDKKKQENKQS